MCVESFSLKQCHYSKTSLVITASSLVPSWSTLCELRVWQREFNLARMVNEMQVLVPNVLPCLGVQVQASKHNAIHKAALMSVLAVQSWWLVRMWAAR